MLSADLVPSDPAPVRTDPEPIDEGRWPTFLVIGAGRCGTTTIHGLLAQHPRVVVPTSKETNFFAMRALGVDLAEVPEPVRLAWGDAVSDPDAYRAIFRQPPPVQAPRVDPPPSEDHAPIPEQPGSEDQPPTEAQSTIDDACPTEDPSPSQDQPPIEQQSPSQEPPPPGPMAFGEVSPVYLVVPGVAELIRDAIPDVRLIVILRDPVDRAISHHAHNLRLGIEPVEDFATAFELDRALGIHSNYFRQGLYAEHLGVYLRLFSREQILLLHYNDLAGDLSGFIRRIYAHIGVDEDVTVYITDPSLQTQPAPIPGEVRDRIADLYADDTLALVREIGFEPARAWSSFRGL